MTPQPGNSPKQTAVGVEGDTLAFERLVFFSDAVFAIAITILVLDIRLPAGEVAFTNAKLTALLLGIWQKYLAYIISFLVIGTFWISHHRKFRYIRRYDSNLLMLNLLFLMAIAFIPFPSSILSEYGNRTATIFYALTIIASGLLSVALWWYAARHNRLIDAHLDARTRRELFVSPLITIAIFVLSIGIAFIDENLARLVWVLSFPISFFIRRKIFVV